MIAVNVNLKIKYKASHQAVASFLNLQFLSPVKEMRADEVLALGSVLTEMGERELQDVDLTDLGVLAHLGTLTDWSPKKVNFCISPKDRSSAWTL